MGLAASQGRLLFITARKNDLEYAMMMINQRRTVLSTDASNLIRTYSNQIYQTNDLNSIANYETGADGIVDVALPGYTAPVTGTPVGQSALPTGAYETDTALIAAEDKELELKALNFQMQHKAVETEYDGVKKVIDKNIDVSFKTFIT